MLWAKHYVGMVTDDKFAAAAEIAAVSPLLPPVLFSSLFERAAENGDGTITGFQPGVFAVKFRVGLDEVTRTLAAFAELAIVVGDRLVNWAKRQGGAAVDAVHKIARKVSTPRTSRWRKDRGLTDREWAVLRAKIIARDQGRCRECGSEKDPHVDHIVALARGGSNLETNLVTLCCSCHSKKTAAEFHHYPQQLQILLPIASPRNAPRNAQEDLERSSETDSPCSGSSKTDSNDVVSRRCAPLGEVKAKRANLIKTLRRWARLSPRLDEDERLPRLQMLDRAEFALDAWDARSIEDKRCFDILAARARASPLDDQVISWVRKAETPQPRAGGLRPLGYVLNGGRNGYPEPEISQMQRS